MSAFLHAHPVPLQTFKATSAITYQGSATALFSLAGFASTPKCVASCPHTSGLRRGTSEALKGGGSGGGRAVQDPHPSVTQDL